MINGVGIYGGFEGIETALSQRNVQNNETILSGDLNGDDGADFANNGENSYHVVTGSGTDPNAVLDGLTITAGNANALDYPDKDGGGIINIDGSPTVSNCMFTGNSANYGGGMYNRDLSFPEVINCTFISNSGSGGGIHNSSCSPRITNCIFVFNSGNEGGAMRNWYSSPQVTNCIFNGNLATGDWGRGGGMHNYYSSPQVINCTFWNNTADHSGGGISNLFDCNPTVANCILWDNTPNEIYDGSGTCTVTYSDVRGGWLGLGENNINADPCFANPNGPDGIAGTADDNLRLSFGSPCIDTGDNSAVTEATDLDGRTRIIDGDNDGTATVDMGAYEYGLFGDIDNSFDIDLNDFAVFALAWGSEPGDLNWNLACDLGLPLDEYIDWRDLNVLCGNWLEGAL